MRRSMASSLWRFSTTRMLHEYVEQLYLPAAASARETRRGRGGGGGREAAPRRRAAIVANQGG